MPRAPASPVLYSSSDEWYARKRQGWSHCSLPCPAPEWACRTAWARQSVPTRGSATTGARGADSRIGLSRNQRLVVPQDPAPCFR